MGNIPDAAYRARPGTAGPLLRAVATHEAGHVVLAWYFGYRVDSVYAYTDGGVNGERGRFEFNDGPRTDGDAWKWERPEDMACIYLAGCIAQARVPCGQGWSDPIYSWFHRLDIRL